MLLKCLKMFPFLQEVFYDKSPAGLARMDGSSPFTGLTGRDWGLQPITAEFHSFGKHFFSLPNAMQADTLGSLTQGVSGNDKE